MSLLLNEVTQEGDNFLRFHDMKLVRERTPIWRSAGPSCM